MFFTYRVCVCVCVCLFVCFSLSRQQEQQRKAQEELAQQETDKKRAASWIHPGVAISVFLIAVVAGVGGYLHHFHKNIKPNLKPYRAPKEKKRRA